MSFGVVLTFPGGKHVLKQASVEDLRKSARDWVSGSIQDHALLLQLIAIGDLEAAAHELDQAMSKLTFAKNALIEASQIDRARNT